MKLSTTLEILFLFGKNEMRRGVLNVRSDNTSGNCSRKGCKSYCLQLIILRKSWTVKNKEVMKMTKIHDPKGASREHSRENSHTVCNKNKEINYFQYANAFNVRSKEINCRHTKYIKFSRLLFIYSKERKYKRKSVLVCIQCSLTSQVMKRMK
jgi:hypothetical protein